MREYWVQVHKSPIVYRYIDWSITVPLQMIEFNLILKAAGKQIGAGMFWRLLVCTVSCLHSAMLVRPVSCLPWLALSLACVVGPSLCSRSSQARQEELSAAAPKQWPPTTTPCASL